MSFLEKIDPKKMPRHIAVIMDGNGRWAKNNKMDRTEGHKEGVVAVRRLIEGAVKTKVEYVTLYTFSTENWNRPTEEIDALMALMVHAIEGETPDLIKNGVRLLAIGDLNRLPKQTKESLDNCIERTSEGKNVTMILSLSYSSRWELVEATKRICEDYHAGKIDKITEDTINNYLLTKDLPEPDLLIRTGGEKRLSNFLLWQMAYTELYFLDSLWPDFDEETLYESIVYYQGRERRFGKTSEQIINI